MHLSVYVKISIPIYVGSIMLKIYWRMTYVSIVIFGLENPVLNPLNNKYIFLIICFRSHNIVPEMEPQRCHLFFFFIFSFSFIRLGTKRLSDQSPRASLFYFHLTWLFWVDCEVVGSNPHSSPYFSFNSPFPPIGRGFDSHASNLFSFYFSLSFTERLWVCIPLLSFLIFIHYFPARSMVRFPLTTLVFTYLFSQLLTWWSHWFDPQWPLLCFFTFHDSLNTLTWVTLINMVLEIWVTFFAFFPLRYTLVLRGIS